MTREKVGEITLNETVFLRDEKPDGTVGGDFSNGAWRTRDLNVLDNPLNYSWITVPTGFENNDFDNNGSTPDATKQRFTLEAGTYEFHAVIPAYKVSSNQARLRNITDSVDTLYSNTQFSNDTSGVENECVIRNYLVLEAQKTFEIQHQCEITATNGFGTGFAAISGTPEIYKQVKITRIG